jgi:hypothetical protein
MSMTHDIPAIIEGLRPYAIHGERYVIVYYSSLAEPETIQHAQLSADALPDDLRVGEPVWVYQVLGVVAGVTRRDPEPSAQ